MRDVYTIGYEGCDIRDFLDTLEAVSIEVLVDVRELPLSRRKGFSKSKLALELRARGIEYLHLKPLGDPKAGREAARAGDWEAFKDVFSSRLSSPDAQIALDELRTLARHRVVCMMCFEKSASCCHRSALSNILTREGWKVFNLVGDRPRSYEDGSRKIPRHSLNQGISAAF